MLIFYKYIFVSGIKMDICNGKQCFLTKRNSPLSRHIVHFYTPIGSVSLWSRIGIGRSAKMGSTSSKFKKYLQHGDEFAAMQIYQSSPELRKNLDPNLSYGENHNHNTALHYAAKHGKYMLLKATQQIKWRNIYVNYWSIVFRHIDVRKTFGRRFREFEMRQNKDVKIGRENDEYLTYKTT